MAREGRPVPRTHGLRLDALRETLSDEVYAMQRDGAAARVAAGKATEARPKPKR